MINDLGSEQRVHKVCLFLLKKGYDVTLVGRRQRKSATLSERPYGTKRMFLLFEKGPLFYAEYNFRLFLLLLFRKADLLVSNDLDTLLPNTLISGLKGSRLVYDSHEYFTGVPELEGKKFKKGLWKRIERYCFRRLKTMYTVNDSIAKLYGDEYGLKPKVVRNFPVYEELPVKPDRKKFSLPEDRKIILYQGSVNVDRGVKEAIEAMKLVSDAILLIVGGGDILDEMYSLAEEQNKKELKIIFYKKVPFEQLREITVLADTGISLDKDTNINYRYSLPNKIFDYVHCGVPVLASPLPEIKKIFAMYDIGALTESHSPVHIAERMSYMLSSPERLKAWKANCLQAAKELCWQNEEKVLEEVYGAPS